MKRIAYVGLSTPILYDYHYQATYQKHPVRGQLPNPILESPFGLILFYDEILFLNKSVCPYNMLNLPYVKFIQKEDEPGLTKEFDFLKSVDPPKSVYSGNEVEDSLQKRYEIFGRKLSNEFQRAVKSFPVTWRSSFDNHARSSAFHGSSVTGNSWSHMNLLFDIDIVKKMGEHGIYVELITNSFSEQWIESNIGSTSEVNLLDVFIIDEIPNYLSKDGPYHEIVEEARNSGFLTDFRTWIVNNSSGAPKNELVEIKDQTISEMRKYRDGLFSKHLDTDEMFFSNSKMFLDLTIDFLGIPVLAQISKARDIIEQIKLNKETNKNRWQGFLVDLEKVYSTKRK